ncbi:MAG: hypothetical protein AMXMBFR58_07720 [Phycisphaerae bacterium]
MFDWIREHDALVWTLVAASLVLAVGMVAVVPWVLGRIPADYFAHEHRPPSVLSTTHPLGRWAGLIAKNVLGWMLVVTGLGMLVLPGPGLLVAFVGLILVDLPGKYRVEKWVVGMPRVARVINWLRARRGAPPLESPRRLRNASPSVGNA